MYTFIINRESESPEINVTLFSEDPESYNFVLFYTFLFITIAKKFNGGLMYKETEPITVSTINVSFLLYFITESNLQRFLRFIESL